MSSATGRLGLYYPFIHFKDDGWLKLAALYWDRMGRVVPAGYAPRDSATVRRLTDELGFVVDVRPGEESTHLAAEFSGLLHRHGAALRDGYGVTRRDLWPAEAWANNPDIEAAMPAGADPRLRYVYSDKLTAALRDALVESGLAEPAPGGHPEWIGMHPRLASVYMTELAEEMAARRRFSPVTDETLDHLAVSGCTIDRLARALLGDARLAGEGITEREIEARVATVAIRAVVPRDIADVPTERIVRLRKEHGRELAAFQSFVHGWASDLSWLAEVEDERALRAHLEIEYAKNLGPQLDDLKARLRSVGLDAGFGALNVQTALPAVVTTGAVVLSPDQINPVLAGVGGLAFGLLPVVRSARKEARDAVAASPVAYLLRLEKDLAPATLQSWVRQRARQFTRGA